MKILIVDDDLDCLETLSNALKPTGFEILLTSSSKEALELIQNTPDINLLITDVRMPEMDGIELVKCLTKINPALNVIVITGERFLKPIFQSLPNCYAFFSKPICFLSLTETILSLN